MKFDHIIWDWSGTISDDLQRVYEATMRVFDTLGIPRITAKEHKEKFVLPPVNFYKGFTVHAADLEPELARLFKRHYAAVRAENEIPLHPIPGMVDVVGELFQSYIPQSVISAHVQGELEREADQYGLAPSFTAIHGDIHRKSQFLPEFVQNLGTDPARIAYIGDMTSDIAAAHAAGVHSIAVIWGYQTAERLASTPRPPHRMAETPQHLEDYILGKNS